MRGVLLSGPYEGGTVEVTRDGSDTGWHIWVLPRAGDAPGPLEGWDIWVDEEDDFAEWFSKPEFQVRWIDPPIFSPPSI